MTSKVCAFEQCGRAIKAKGYCSAHYSQLLKGKELTPIGSTYSGGSRNVHYGPNGDWHGTTGGYTNHNCRCPLCKAVWNAYCSGRKARNVGISNEEKPGILEHGLPKSYQAGCRCAACRKAQSAYSVMCRYFVSSEEYERLQSKADGKCMCCGRETKLVVDYDNELSVLRGMLCVSCNVGIGQLGDNVAGVQAALDYLLTSSPVGGIL